MTPRFARLSPPILLLSLLCAPPVRACMCRSQPTSSQAFSNAAAVFVGKAIEDPDRKIVGWIVLWNGQRHPLQSPTPRAAGAAGRSFFSFPGVHISVEQVYKGDVHGTLAVTQGSCDYPFKEGETYLIYADSVGSAWVWVSACGRTRPLRLAGHEIDSVEAAEKH